MLPYRFGTHSGWLEACFDLGTAVIAPSCGFYGQQHPCGVFTYTVDLTLTGAIRVLRPLVKYTMQRGLRADLGRLRELLADRLPEDPDL